MKNLRRLILCFLTLFAVFFSAATNLSRVAAQEIPIPMPLNKHQRLMASVIIEPAMKSFFEKPRSGMLGLSFAMNPMFKAGFAKEIDFTDEQFDSILGRLQERFVNEEGVAPEALENFGKLMQQFDERAKELVESGEDIDTLPISEEELATLRNGFDFMYTQMSDVAYDIFTPEQMEKINELEFAVFGGVDSPFLNIDSMDVLDLTDEQKKEIQKFQEETKDEKKELLNGISEFTRKIIKTGKVSIQDGKDFEEKHKKYAQKIKDRLREILTEEQLKKANRIVKKQTAMLQKMMGGMGTAASWIPGADAWKPGQAIPESLLPKDSQRKPRFPRARKTVEQTETVETE